MISVSKRCLIGILVTVRFGVRIFFFLGGGGCQWVLGHYNSSYNSRHGIQQSRTVLDGDGSPHNYLGIVYRR